MTTTRLQQQIAFLVELDKLKTIYRRSYLATDPSRKENDAEHMWHISVMALVLQEYCPVEIDINRVIRLLLLHDVVELDAGDVSVYLRQNNLELVEKEKQAAQRIFGLLPAGQAQEMLAAWTEFEAGQTPEARFARAVDRIMPILLNYYTQGKTWQDVKASYDQVIAVNRKIGDISPQLWDFVKQIIDDSLAKGYLLRRYNC
jgi:putative hydrolase of HD superfamily